MKQQMPGGRPPGRLRPGRTTSFNEADAALAAQSAVAHARLAELEATYATTPVGLCVLDRDLRYVRINERLAELNGLPVADHIGRTIFEVVPDVASKAESRFRRILETGEPSLSVELSAETSSQPGMERAWLEHAVPLRGIHGEIIGISLVVEEITERKRTEELLGKLQRLQTAGRLAGGIAHEANNQMTVVLGCTNLLLQRGDLPADVRENLEDIQRAAQRTAAVTQQLLAFSRRQMLRPADIDLNTLVKEFAPFLGKVLGEKCRVELRLWPGEARVMADGSQIEQALHQLAFNARDAMPLGGTVTVEIAILTVPAGGTARQDVAVRPGDYVVVTVRDTGEGMDRETLQHVFEPFVTTREVGQGTGLGLATVYGIIKQSGGYIWAESEKHRGTVFTIYLPAAA